MNRIKFASEEDLNRIHKATIKILEEKGVVFHCDDALEIFKKNGAKVEGKIVYFPKKMVERAIEQSPSKYRFVARNDAHSITIGEGTVVATNAGCIYIQDLDNGRRPGKLKDYADIQKLYQASQLCNMVGHTPVDTSDIDPDEKHLYMMYETLKNTDKPVLGHVADKFKGREMLDMVEIAFGKKDIMNDHCVACVSINPISPLSYSPESCETIIEYANRNQALFLGPAPMTGISSPVRLPGTVVLQNAEALAGIVFVQLINPGNPVVYMPGGFIGSMKDAKCITGSPEIMMMNAVNIQLALEFYHLPTRLQCGTTDAKDLDIQAGYETMQNIMMSMFAGVHVFHLPLGVLDSIFTTSLEKMIIDEEIFRRVLRISEGLDISDKALSMDVIQDIDHGGMYLDHPDTFEQCRNVWLPDVSNWGSFDDWKKGISEDVLVRANRIYKERLQNAPDSLIDPHVDQELKAYIKSEKGKNSKLKDQL